MMILPPEPPPPFAPRVLLVIVDDVGAEQREAANTPNLDRIAEEAATFEHYWAAPMCSPFRARVFSGCYAFRDENLVGRVIQPKHGTLWSMPPSHALANFLQSASFYGKWHLGHTADEAAHPMLCGFTSDWWGTGFNLGGDGTYYAGPCWDNGQQDHWAGYITSETATNAIDRGLVNQDELVVASFHAVHKPFEAPPRDMHTLGDLTGASDEVLAAAMLEAVDQSIGELYARARALGYTVIVTSDNGTPGLLGGPKGSLSEPALNTFLYIAGDGIVPGPRPDQLVDATDLYDTILDLTGRVGPERPDSFSLLPSLLDPVCTSERDFMFVDVFGKDGQNGVHDPAHWNRALRDRRWKAVLHAATLAEFYDLRNDPHEESNLAGQNLTDEQHAGLERLLAKHPE